MKGMKAILVAFLSASLLVPVTSCRSSDWNNRNVGTGTGAIIGGLIGTQIGKGHGRTAAIITGAVLGGYLGGRIGESMDDYDRQQTHRALERNHYTTWRNPRTHRRYAVTPVSTYRRDGYTCRRFKSTAMIDGKLKDVYGRACRRNGRWQIVK